MRRSRRRPMLTAAADHLRNQPVKKEGSHMTSVGSVRDVNRDLARQINEETRLHPDQSPYANKFVGIANGQVVVVADDLDTMICRPRQIEPDPTQTFGLEANE